MGCIPPLFQHARDILSGGINHPCWAKDPLRDPVRLFCVPPTTLIFFLHRLSMFFSDTPKAMFDAFRLQHVAPHLEFYMILPQSSLKNHRYLRSSPSDVSWSVAAGASPGTAPRAAQRRLPAQVCRRSYRRQTRRKENMD